MFKTAFLKKTGCERKASSILHPKMTPGSILNTVHYIRFRLRENTFSRLHELLVCAATDMHIIVVKRMIIYYPLKKYLQEQNKVLLIMANISVLLKCQANFQWKMVPCHLAKNLILLNSLKATRRRGFNQRKLSL